MELTFPLIVDGATGTELQKRGFGGGECAEKWVLEHPEVIMEIQRGYVEAGSQVIYAPTFGANRVKLEAHGIFNRVEEYNRCLVELSRQASAGRAFVAGDIAPTGLFLYPMGETSFEELVEIYTEQAAALEQAGVDLFAVETMMSVADARAALLAIRSVSEKPVFVTFTCDERGRTLTGSDPAAVLQIFQGMGVDAFGLNCSTGPREMKEILKRLGRITRVPLIAKPNAGMPEMTDHGAVYHCPPDEFTAYLDEMAAAGVMIFGGCCGTTSEHIRALKEKTAAIKLRRPAPENADRLPCATEKELFFLDPMSTGGPALRCDASLEDSLGDLEEDAPMITLAIENEEELEAFANAQAMISRPLCLQCAETSLLEKALRLYQGRALYEGPLDEETLAPLARKYGLIY